MPSTNPDWDNTATPSLANLFSWERPARERRASRWRERMRCVSWLAAAGLVMVTAGCVEQSGYPTTSGYSPGYGSSNYGYSGYSNNYASQPSYYPAGPELLLLHATAAAPNAGGHPDPLCAGAGLAASAVLQPIHEGQRPGWRSRPLRSRQERRRRSRQVPAFAVVSAARRRDPRVAPFRLLGTALAADLRIVLAERRRRPADTARRRRELERHP